MTGADLFTDARRFASYHAAEQTLFTATGRWMREVDEPAVRTRLAAWNQLHAEHVGWWASRYPTIEELPTIDEVSAEPVFEPTLADRLEGRFDDAVTALVDALDALADAYETGRERVDARLDGPTARVLDLALIDTRAQLAECHHLPPTP